MRQFWLIQLVFAMVLLPMSGVAVSHADAVHQSHQTQSSTAQSKAEASAHCASMAAKANASNDKPAATADCCDASPCAEHSQCAADCGHCVAQGHSCSLPTFNTLPCLAAQADNAKSPATELYSHIGPQPTPPPNIA